MGVKSKNHHFKKLLRLLSCQLGASSRHRGTCVVGDAVGDAGVAPNGGASEGPPSSRCQFAHLDGLRGNAGITQGALLHRESLHQDKSPVVTSKSAFPSLRAAVTAKLLTGLSSKKNALFLTYFPLKT